MNRSEAVKLLDRIHGRHSLNGMTEENWREAWADIQDSFTGTQFYHLLRMDRMDLVPSWLQSELKAESDRVLFQNMLIRSELKKLLKAFDAAKIPVIPLKGIRMAERYFGHFAARPTTDLDLLVNPQDLERASKLLSGMDFQQDDSPDSDHFHLLFNKFYDNPMFPFLAVELHWDILRSHASDTDTGGLWERSQPYPGYAGVRELSDEDSLYHICLHGFNHQMLSLKYILDVARLVVETAPSLRWATMTARARKDGNYSKLITVLSLVYSLCPSLEKIKPLPERKRWPLWNEELMREAGLGLKSRRYYFFRLLSIFVMYDSAGAMLNHLRYLFLPPRDYARSQFREDKGGSLLSLYTRIYRIRLRNLFGGGAARAGTKEYDI